MIPLLPDPVESMIMDECFDLRFFFSLEGSSPPETSSEDDEEDEDERDEEEESKESRISFLSFLSFVEILSFDFDLS